MPRFQRLSALDALFLQLESARTPMHTGSVAVFDGTPLRPGSGARIDVIRSVVTNRLHLVPKLRQRVWFPVSRQARPVWVEDREFDVRRHVRLASVPAPGTDEQLLALAAELLSDPLDRARPLWELWLIEGLAGGRFAFVEKVHHAMADGVANVELATILLDPLPDPTTTALPVPVRPSHRDSQAVVLAAILCDRGLRGVRAGRGVLRQLRHPLHGVRGVVDTVAPLRSLVTTRLVAPHSSINRAIGSGRRLTAVHFSLDELRRVEKAFDVTINDVLLASVAGGLRRLLDGRGELEEQSELQALVPVATSQHGDRALGNEVSAMIVRLPVGRADPVERLHHVAHAMGQAKETHQSRATDVIVAALESLPNLALGVAAMIVDHQPIINLVVTNVPGPQVPLYSLGARMLDVIPVVPLAGNLSVGIAAFSYDGGLSVGIFADPDRCPDTDVLADGMTSSLAELVVAARRTSPTPRTATATHSRRSGGSAKRPARATPHRRRPAATGRPGAPRSQRAVRSDGGHES